MISAEPLGTLGLVASLLEAFLYQGNDDMNNRLCNIVSTERHRLRSVCRCCWNVATCKWKVHKEKTLILFKILKGKLSIELHHCHI
jgi:hypothetical protein